MFILLSTQPLIAIILSVIYIAIIYVLIRKEQKSVTYSLTAILSFLQIGFLYLWFSKLDVLEAGSNIGFDLFNDLFAFVNTAYLLLATPFLLILAWYGVKTIMKQDQSIWLKRIFSVVYLAALVGVLILGRLIFVILYYGFAP